METITKALNKNVSVDTGPTKEELRARLLSELERVKELLLVLERPEYRSFVRFAVAWCKLDHSLRALEGKIQDPSTEKPIGTLDELWTKLVEKN